jgi:dolichol-phosphate mannosyltransferase
MPRRNPLLDQGPNKFAMSIPPQPMNPAPPLSLPSVVIPAQNEAEALPATVEHLHLELRLNQIPHEIIVLDDGSSDRTWEVLQEIRQHMPELQPVRNKGQNGFGRAIAFGLRRVKGDAVVIVMADESDDVRDVTCYWQVLNKGYDCVFGSRFVKGGGVIDYPPIKLLINRMANFFIRLLFGISLNDTTNAFKAYRRTVIEACEPLISALSEKGNQFLMGLVVDKAKEHPFGLVRRPLQQLKNTLLAPFSWGEPKLNAQGRLHLDVLREELKNSLGIGVNLRQLQNYRSQNLNRSARKNAIAWCALAYQRCAVAAGSLVL